MLIEAGPFIERLASLFQRSENAQSNGDRVCEARILAPNLILLDLTHVCAGQTRGSRQLRGVTIASAAPILTPELGKQRPSDTATDVPASHVEQEATVLGLSREEQLPSPDPMQESWSPEPIEPALQIGPLRLDPRSHWAYLNEKKLHLTPTEFRILECLLREPERTFTRPELLELSIWSASVVEERTVDVHIRALRVKLGEARNLIETVRRVGYRFNRARACGDQLHRAKIERQNDHVDEVISEPVMAGEMAVEPQLRN